MKKVLMIFGMLLLTASCVDLNGSLQVREAFNVKKKSGFLNLKNKIVTLAPGKYRAELTAVSRKNLKLVISGDSIGEINIPIKSDSNLNIPMNGQIFIDSRKIDQPFSVTGLIHTDQNEYGYTNIVEKCERTITERRCEKICEKEVRKCEIACKDVAIIIEGRKDISFHYLRTDREVELEFMPENSTAIVAKLPVRGTEIRKIIDSETLCR